MTKLTNLELNKRIQTISFCDKGLDFAYYLWGGGVYLVKLKRKGDKFVVKQKI